MNIPLSIIKNQKLIPLETFNYHQSLGKSLNKIYKNPKNITPIKKTTKHQYTKNEIIKWFTQLNISQKTKVCTIQNFWLSNILYQMKVLYKFEPNSIFTPTIKYEEFMKKKIQEKEDSKKKKNDDLNDNNLNINYDFYTTFFRIENPKKIDDFCCNSITNSTVSERIQICKKEKGFLEEIRFITIDKLSDTITLSIDILNNIPSLINYMNFFSKNNIFTNIITSDYDSINKIYNFSFPLWIINLDKFTLPELLTAIFEQVISIYYQFYMNDKELPYFHKDEKIDEIFDKTSKLENFLSEESKGDKNKFFLTIDFKYIKDEFCYRKEIREMYKEFKKKCDEVYSQYYNSKIYTNDDDNNKFNPAALYSCEEYLNKIFNDSIPKFVNTLFFVPIQKLFEEDNYVYSAVIEQLIELYSKKNFDDLLNEINNGSSNVENKKKRKNKHKKKKKDNNIEDIKIYGNEISKSKQIEDLKLKQDETNNIEKIIVDKVNKENDSENNNNNIKETQTNLSQIENNINEDNQIKNKQQIEDTIENKIEKHKNNNNENNDNNIQNKINDNNDDNYNNKIIENSNNKNIEDNNNKSIDDNNTKNIEDNNNNLINQNHNTTNKNKKKEKEFFLYPIKKSKHKSKKVKENGSKNCSFKESNITLDNNSNISSPNSSKISSPKYSPKLSSEQSSKKLFSSNLNINELIQESDSSINSNSKNNNLESNTIINNNINIINDSNIINNQGQKNIISSININNPIFNYYFIIDNKIQNPFNNNIFPNVNYNLNEHLKIPYNQFFSQYHPYSFVGSFNPLSSLVNNQYNSFFIYFSKEIQNNSNNVTETLESINKYRNYSIEKIKELIKETLSKTYNIDFLFYGSYITELRIESSDVDILVKFESKEEEKIKNESSNYQIEKIISELVMIFNQNSKSLNIDNIKPIYTASVPVLKIQCNIENDIPKEIKDNIYKKFKFDKSELNLIKFDLTFYEIKHNEKITSIPSQLIIEFIKNSLICNPEIKPILLVLKRYMQICKLNSSFHGGISSFSLFLLLYAYLKHLKVYLNNFNINYPMGNILFDFFEFYSKFNFGIYCIDVKSPKPYILLSELHENGIMILDPFTNLNVAKSSFRVDEIKSAFKDAMNIIKKNLFHSFSNKNQFSVNILEEIFKLK